MEPGQQQAGFFLLLFSYFCIESNISGNTFHSGAFNFSFVNIFQAEQISKSYSDKLLFDGISLSIFQGDKVALIAKNGSGKTTLLNIIAGIDTADEGICSYKSDLSIAYLEQQPVFDANLRVSQVLLHADNEVCRAVREYEEFLEEEGTDTAAYQQRLQHLVERMDALDAWDYEQRIKQILTQLKVGNLKITVDQLSGGQQKRLALARILIDESDFILLDEPTNHLDLEMVEWLETYLSRKKTSLLVVTHDRYFLDAVCNGIVELEQGNLYAYRGNYTYFLEKKQERLNSQSKETERASNLLRKETEWMRRSPQARTTKSKARIGAFYELEEKASQGKTSQIDNIRMDMMRMGKKILEIKSVAKRYDTLNLIEDFSYVFKKRERVGIVGPNGSGKSTLLNIITGQLSPDKGSVITGETIHFGYYRQEGLQINDDKRVIDVITDIAESISMHGNKSMSASQMLYHFNFPHPSQYDKVGKLSGGEKRRLYLLTVLMKNPNFLILDEPTNDFDIDTLNVLESFLLGFEGCLIIVSHDRYFLDQLVDHLFVFEGNGAIRDFPGNYTQYRLNLAEKAALTKKQEKPAETIKSNHRLPQEKKKLSYKEQKELESLEQDIATLENEKTSLMADLSGGALDQKQLIDASQRFQELEEQLNAKGDRWLELSELL
jgi:ABC transport system ATP-binding/permease protein